jgi:uncharacterized membrane protein YoaK (UPF0700 family)
MRQVYFTIALLCSIAGSVDTLSYLRLGRLFVANLTGNTVFFAYYAAVQHWTNAAKSLAIVFSFFSGVVTNNLLKRWMEGDRRALSPVIVSLMIECTVLCILALLGMREYLRVALLLTLAWTMGLQNDAFQKIGPVNLNTAFLTGDIQKLGSAIANPSHDTEKSRQRRQLIAAFSIAWLAYVAGAVLGAVGSHFFQLRALLIPAVMVGIVLAMEWRGRK